MMQMFFIFAVSAFAFTGLFLLERVEQLRHARHDLWKRLIVNACVTTLAFAVNAAIVLPASLLVLNQAQQKSFGLVHLVELPVWFSSAIAFLLLDLTYYYWHRANHQFPFLWRFHNAHHTRVLDSIPKYSCKG